MRLLFLIATCAMAQGIAQEMAQIPAGEFTMGRTKLTPDDKTGMRPVVLLDDRPPHKLKMSAFEMDKTEVTHGAYAKFVEATGRPAPYHWSKRPADNVPIYNVDWSDADAYCRWVGKRLPTEAEWERAARGGIEGASYPWGDDKPTAKLAHFNVQTGAAPVARHPANGFGLFDMAGSVSEWTQDWFDRDYYSKSPASDPPGPPIAQYGEYKVIRGGAWPDAPSRITVFFRNWVRPNQKTPNLGFRCAR